MADLVEILRDDTLEVRVTGTFADGTLAVENTKGSGQSKPRKKRNEAYAHRHYYTTPAHIGFVSHAAVRVALLLDPRNKICDEERCTNGGSFIKIECLAEVNTYVAKSVDYPTSPDSLPDS